MSGFSNEAVDSEFFANTRIKSNFICSIGHGSNENLFPRNPRLTFEVAGRFAERSGKMNSSKTAPKVYPARHWIKGEWVGSSAQAISISPSTRDGRGLECAGGRNRQRPTT